MYPLWCVIDMQDPIMTRVIRNLFNGDKIPLWQLQVTAARQCSRCLRKFVAFVISGLPPRIKINEL